MLTVACVLKSGGDFSPEYVERLRDGVAKNLPIPHRFICLSDVSVPCERIPLQHGWPRWWSKMELFRPDIEGDLLYFDLDTVICGDLSDISRIERMTMLGQTGHRPMSGVMVLPQQDRGPVWRQWIKEPEYLMLVNQSPNQGDQAVIGECRRGGIAFFDDLVKGQVVSYALDVRPYGEIPDNSRVVYFCRPVRPRDVNWLDDLICCN